MLKKNIIIAFILAVITISGCGSLFSSKPVPPLEGYSKIVIAPFNIKKPTGKFTDLPTMLSYGMGTKIGIRFRDKELFYDQSNEVTPVSDKIKELNLSKASIFENDNNAIKLGKAFGADLIITGLMNEPRYTIERSGKMEYDMKDVSNIGAARYYTVGQTATLRAKVKIIDVNSEKVIWSGDIVGFKRYKTRYRTGESEKTVREETMFADVRKDFVDNAVAKLYPERPAK